MTAASSNQQLDPGIGEPVCLFAGLPHMGHGCHCKRERNSTIRRMIAFYTGSNGDSFAGSFTNQFVNLDGQMVFAGSGTFTGTRLEVEPLTP